MMDVEQINAEFKAEFWAALPGAIMAINAEKDDGFTLPTPGQIIEGFESEVPQKNPFVVFDVRDVEGEKGGIGVDVMIALYVAYTDFPKSADNRKAYYRYCRAVHSAIASVKQKNYRSKAWPTWIGKETGVYLPGMERQMLKAAGCFVNYKIGIVV